MLFFTHIKPTGCPSRPSVERFRLKHSHRATTTSHIIMSKLFVVALCLLLVGVVSMADCRRTIREAPATTTDVDNSLTLTDLVKQTDDALKSLQANLLAFVGVKDTAELTTVLQTQTRSVADKLQATVTQIVEEAKNIQASEQVKGLTDKLTTQINDWKRENPEVVQSVENYKV